MMDIEEALFKKSPSIKVIIMTWKDEIKKNDESREKALDTLGECLRLIGMWQSQHYSPYESERRLNPTKRPAKYGSASGKLEREPTHKLIFKIKDMIEKHIIDERW